MCAIIKVTGLSDIKLWPLKVVLKVLESPNDMSQSCMK